MKKENILFGFVGLMAGLIIGFLFTNSINKQATTALQTPPSQNANLPAGHPEISGQQADAAVPEVQADIERAKNEPNNFDAQMDAAEMYSKINRYNEALDFLKRANELKPDDYTTIVQLGNVNFDAGRYEEAEKWYASALGKKASDVNVRTDMGLTFMFRQPPDYDRAIQEFKRSLQIDPNHSQTLQNLVVAWVKKGNVQEASLALGNLERIEPQNPALARLKADIEAIKTK